MRGSSPRMTTGCAELSFVMPGLVPGIHALLGCNKDVDGRDKPGHDDGWVLSILIPRPPLRLHRP